MLLKTQGAFLIMTLIDSSYGELQIAKFGQNADIDTAAAEDVWSVGGLIPFPSAAAVTTIVSSSTADDDGGTGANTVYIDGIDNNGYFLSETVTMNGISAVTLTNQFRHVNRMYAVVSGSGLTNAGIIQVKHGSTVLCEIPASVGQSQTTGYVLPANWQQGRLEQIYINVNKTVANTIVSAQFMIKPDGGSWRNVYPITLSTTRNQVEHRETYKTPLTFAPLTAFRWHVASVSANDTAVEAGLDIVGFGLSTPLENQ